MFFYQTCYFIEMINLFITLIKIKKYCQIIFFTFFPQKIQLKSGPRKTPKKTSLKIKHISLKSLYLKLILTKNTFSFNPLDALISQTNNFAFTNVETILISKKSYLHSCFHHLRQFICACMLAQFVFANVLGFKDFIKIYRAKSISRLLFSWFFFNS